MEPKLELFDTHAHLEDDRFRGEVDQVMVRARQAGLSQILAVGTTHLDSQACLERARREPMVVAAVGLHPTHLAGLPEDAFGQVEALAMDARVVAIGETGMDNYWKEVPLELQEALLLRHLELSRRLNKPVILHCRDAGDRLMTILRDNCDRHGTLRGILHSFCGTADEAKQALELGLHLSFSGMITQKGNQPLLDIASSIRRDRLLVETDSPYLAPRPQRGKRNEPAFVVHTCAALAECHGLSLREMAQVTTNNARRLLGMESAI